MRVPKLALIFDIAFSAFGGSALAETSPPKWEIHDLCPMVDNDLCLNRENSARLTVLARWATVPEEDRSACMREIDQQGRQSYGRLIDCFDDRAMKALESAP